MSAMKAQAGMSGRVDWTYVLAVVGLVATGTIAMLSAASTTTFYSAILQKHFIAMALGVMLFTLTLAFNYQVFQDQSKPLYVIALVMMTAVLFIGTVAKGHRAWIRLPGFNFQPAGRHSIMLDVLLARVASRPVSLVSGRVPHRIKILK